MVALDTPRHTAQRLYDGNRCAVPFDLLELFEVNTLVEAAASRAEFQQTHEFGFGKLLLLVKLRNQLPLCSLPTVSAPHWLPSPASHLAAPAGLIPPPTLSC